MSFKRRCGCHFGWILNLLLFTEYRVLFFSRIMVALSDLKFKFLKSSVLWVLKFSYFSRQWAAVRMCVLEMSDPPHHKKFLWTGFVIIATWYGGVPTATEVSGKSSVSSKPLFLMPSSELSSSSCWKLKYTTSSPFIRRVNLPSEVQGKQKRKRHSTKFST